MSKPLIPFSWMPGSWGLKGKTREIAKAEYELDGFELDIQLARINTTDPEAIELALIEVRHNHDMLVGREYEKAKILNTPSLTDEERELALLKLDFNYGDATQYDVDKRVLELADEGTEFEREVAMLDLELEHDRIEQTTYDRKVADLKGEPFVSVIRVGLEDAASGYMELDWNDHFVSFLQGNGYKGSSDEDIVNKWFNQMCRTILVQEGADQDYGMENGITADRPDVEFIRDHLPKSNDNE